MSEMKIIGITGGIACGKSNLTGALKKAGAHVIDADEISRNLTADGGKALQEIRSAFGNAVFDGEKLNRRALADLIFTDEEKRKQLNGILHPLVFQEISRQMKLARESKEKVVFLDIPLLYETGAERLCDAVWCAYIPGEEQITRLMLRDGITREKALDKIHSQMSALDKKNRADKVIDTSGTPEESARIVLQLYHDLLSE